MCAYPPIKVYGRAHALREYEARKKSPTKKSSFKVSKADDYWGVKTWTKCRSRYIQFEHFLQWEQNCQNKT